MRNISGGGDHIQPFIDRWLGTAGGAERANYQLFLSGFCDALGLDAPAPAVKGVLGDYQFEGPVAGGSAAGNKVFPNGFASGAYRSTGIRAELRSMPILPPPTAARTRRSRTSSRR